METLRAAVETIVPPDGWEGGVAALLEREPLEWARAPLARAARRLEAGGFVTAPDRHALLDRLARDDPDAFAALLRVTYEGYYGSAGAWERIGFRSLGTAPRHQEPEPLPVVAPGELRARYDAIVIGAGAGGGVAAAVLAERGLTVLVVERARRHTNAELRGDHLHGKRMALYDPTAGPGPGHPRVLQRPDGTTERVDCVTDPWAWGLNAMALGGGTRVWQGMAWRFMPEDFAMATHYGVPPDSTLADWPLSYGELAPYYDRAEWAIGVAGASTGPLTARFEGARPYPMPPLPEDAARRAFGAAADRLGWGWGPVPLAINSIPGGGRAACARCPTCVGHTCPTDAKNGTHNTMLPRAVATGGCDILVCAQATRIEHARGRAGGVRLVTAAGVRSVRGDRVVVSAGAVETPRLLLVSGLGNATVGTNLHSHAFAVVFGTAGEPLKPFDGPGHSIATLDFVHRDGEAWGGGVLFDAPPPLPLTAAQYAPLFGAPAYGAAHKAWMRERLPYVVGAMGVGQEVPCARARVTADPHVTDVHGMPVARLAGALHPATLAVRGYMRERLTRWLAEVGVEGLVDPGARRPPAAAGEHSAGTCRMGEDPATSACDRHGRLHGTENVFAADASLLPTNGSVNPGLTVMANAWRVAAAVE